MTAARPKPLIFGNWKMHLTVSQARSFLQELLPLLPHREDREIAVAPAYTALAAVRDQLKGHSVRLAAQNLFWEGEGPYTGEVSALMLQELGVVYVLVGHSERRQHLGETDRMVGRKVRAALSSSINPIVCVGEQESARSAGRAAAVVRKQVLRAFENVSPEDVGRLAVAYEPTWAVGSGRPASVADASEMHRSIRQDLVGLFADAGHQIRILYGGSVTAQNIDGFLGDPAVDGALVGGASLQPREFGRIAGFLP